MPPLGRQERSGLRRMGPASAAGQRGALGLSRERMTPNPKLPCDRLDGRNLGFRPPHPVKHRYADGSLGLLASNAAGSIGNS